MLSKAINYSKLSSHKLELSLAQFNSSLFLFFIFLLLMVIFGYWLVCWFLFALCSSSHLAPSSQNFPFLPLQIESQLHLANFLYLVEFLYTKTIQLEYFNQVFNLKVKISDGIEQSISPHQSMPSKPQLILKFKVDFIY